MQWNTRAVVRGRFPLHNRTFTTRAGNRRRSIRIIKPRSNGRAAHRVYRTRISGHKRERRSGACAIIYEAPQFCTKLRQFASCYTTHGAGRCARLATRSKTGIYSRLSAAAGKEGGGRAVLGHKRDEHVYYMRGTYCGSCAAFKTHEHKE